MNITKSLVHLMLLALSNAFTNKTLVLVNLVYRHGARSPIEFFPNNQYINQWPVDPGMLTKVGMNMEFELGKFLKKRYIESSFINQSYIAKEVYIRSSDESRCLQSAETQLAGLYPPIGYQVWNENITWQPIPVHTVPGDVDPVLRSDDTYCPRLKKLLKQLTLKPEYIQKEHENQDFLRVLSNYSGMTVNFTNLWIIDDAIKCEKAQGFKGPKWYKEVEKPLHELAAWIFLQEYNEVDDELGRLLGGNLLNLININMLKYFDSKSYDGIYKLTMYSGHDTSIMSLTAALNVDITPPTFASCFMIELYQHSNGDLYVEMQFRNDTSGNTVPFKLKNCGFSCPLLEFLRLTSRRTANKQHCYNESKNDEIFTFLQLKIGAAVFMSLTIVLIFSLFIFIIRRKRALIIGHKRLLEI
ncbi:lysosomal acid phosphatase isoform X1 [Hydra vulgaris]|uniref:lysosomal acid phosphatase isoform X1 n=1 Tax=Hydra vulgaris TaxID=6087 RepID=UPI001F5E87B8|nr:lysosomal acid phosphatase [Hydra vulgaris]